MLNFTPKKLFNVKHSYLSRPVEDRNLFFARIESIKVNNFIYRENFFEFIASCRNLKEFTFTNCSLGIAVYVQLCLTLRYLSDSLEVLDVSGCFGWPLSDTLPFTNNLHNLKRISLAGFWSFEPGHVIGMIERNRNSLEHVNLAGLKYLSDPVLDCLIVCCKDKLISLNISRCIQLTEAAVRSLVINCTCLSDLNLKGIDLVSATVLAELNDVLRSRRPVFSDAENNMLSKFCKFT